MQMQVTRPCSFWDYCKDVALRLGGWQTTPPFSPSSHTRPSQASRRARTRGGTPAPPSAVQPFVSLQLPGQLRRGGGHSSHSCHFRSDWRESLRVLCSLAGDRTRERTDARVLVPLRHAGMLAGTAFRTRRGTPPLQSLETLQGALFPALLAPVLSFHAASVTVTSLSTVLSESSWLPAAADETQPPDAVSRPHARVPLPSVTPILLSCQAPGADRGCLCGWNVVTVLHCPFTNTTFRVCGVNAYILLEKSILQSSC